MEDGAKLAAYRASNRLIRSGPPSSHQVVDLTHHSRPQRGVDRPLQRMVDVVGRLRLGSALLGAINAILGATPRPNGRTNAVPKVRHE